MSLSRHLFPSATRCRATARAAGALAALALLASGCAGSADEAEGVDLPAASTGLHPLVSADGERQYYLDLPEGYSPDGEPLPLVLALHGTGGSHAKWLDDTYNLADAVGDDAIMVYPEALVSTNGTRQWVTERDVPYVAAVLDQLENQVTFDHDNVLVTGQSSGAGMSHEIGCQLGDRVRAIAPAAGVLMSTRCTGSVAVIQVQGTSDPVVPFALAQQTSEFWARYNGLDTGVRQPGTHDSCTQYPTADGTVEATNAYPVHLCMHNEGAGEERQGHAWPSIAGDAIWSTFTALPRTQEAESAPAGGGNDKTIAEANTTAKFTLKFPETIPSTPTQGAVVVYAPGEVTPTTAPLAFMTMQFAPGDVQPGQEVSYEVPVSYSIFGADGFSLPGSYTIMVTMHTENGGYPIPVPGMDMWTMTEYDFVDTDTPVVIDDVLALEPISTDTGL
ncbi:alpha/beta hydrolase family esterase [Nocardioides yefusunii]|uniref:Alpha/beta hydrolase family esterase n=1 Tax=Nocardioides yefusunii TaxID=2500546 RepID=A0ABW1QY16_9ACTN|nr:PHB depolymerase family esterase [Nocardioides yefusunii]